MLAQYLGISEYTNSIQNIDVDKLNFSKLFREPLPNGFAFTLQSTDLDYLIEYLHYGNTYALQINNTFIFGSEDSKTTREYIYNMYMSLQDGLAFPELFLFEGMSEVIEC